MGEITIEEWQGQLDEIDSEIKYLQNRKNNLIESLENKKEFDYIKGKLVKRIELYGMFYNMTIYSHFDGHMSEGVYYYKEGVDEISLENFNKLKNLITEYHSLKKPTMGSNVYSEKLRLNEGALLAIENTGCEEFEELDVLKYFKIIDEDTLQWMYKGDGEQGEPCDNSSFIVKKTTEKEIKSTKRVNSN